MIAIQMAFVYISHRIGIQYQFADQPATIATLSQSNLAFCWSDSTLSKRYGRLCA